LFFAFLTAALQVYIAAFAISGYSTASFRNRYKPFNPVLGETYECMRDDMGFRLVCEQVKTPAVAYLWSFFIKTTSPVSSQKLRWHPSNLFTTLLSFFYIENYELYIYPISYGYMV